MQSLGEARLVVGGVVGVDDPLAGRLVVGAGRVAVGRLGGGAVAGGEAFADPAGVGLERGADGLVPHPARLVLPVPLDLGLDVGQGRSALCSAWDWSQLRQASTAARVPSTSHGGARGPATSAVRYARCPVGSSRRTRAHPWNRLETSTSRRLPGRRSAKRRTIEARRQPIAAFGAAANGPCASTQFLHYRPH